MSFLMPWAIRAQPQESELLSSYLVQVAHAHGMSAYRFCSFHFPGVCIWNRDIDRTASNNLLSRIAFLSNLPTQTIHDMTLREWRQAISGLPKSPFTAPATDAWFNSVGILNHKRKGFGLQYCPRCLAEKNSYRKEWRLSFATTCLKHSCSLSDCCGRCQAPICFYRNDALPTHCWCCGHRLADFAGTYDAGLEERMIGQSKLMHVLHEKSVVIDASLVDSRSYFMGISLLLRTIKSTLVHSDKSIQVSPQIAHCSGERIERQRLVDRAEQCLVIFRLLNDWPESMWELAADLKMNQCSFAKNELVPGWLVPTLALLPSSARRHRVRKTAPIRHALRSIHRKKATGWRYERASILLTAVGTRT